MATNKKTLVEVALKARPVIGVLASRSNFLFELRSLVSSPLQINNLIKKLRLWIAPTTAQFRTQIQLTLSQILLVISVELKLLLTYTIWFVVPSTESTHDTQF